MVKIAKGLEEITRELEHTQLSRGPRPINIIAEDLPSFLNILITKPNGSPIYARLNADGILKNGTEEDWENIKETLLRYREDFRKIYEDLMDLYMLQLSPQQLLEAKELPEVLQDSLKGILDKGLHFEPEE